MPVLESSVLVAASPEAAFDLTQDYGRRLEWDPFLSEARLVDGATAAAPGVRAWCVSRALRVGMETEYVSARRGRVAAVRMTKGPWPIGRFAGSWLFRPEAAGTRVTFRYHVSAVRGLLGWLAQPLMVWWFRRETVKRLEALARALDGRT
jgi:ribosome-associated toxin RatA of RatAB toxin-antitoxin module